MLNVIFGSPLDSKKYLDGNVHTLHDAFVTASPTNCCGLFGVPYYIKPTTVRKICSDSCKDI